jgi:hypothetical protein
MILDTVIKSPAEEYRTLLRSAIKKSGKNQSCIALDADMEPGNLSHILAGRRKPLRSYQKNQALAKACGQQNILARDMQFAAEQYHALARQPRNFRRYMVVTTLALNSLLEKTIGALESDQAVMKPTASERNIPEPLIAMAKIIESLRYMWPLEPDEKWDDYPVIANQMLRRLGKLSSQKQVDTVVKMEVAQALEWVRDQGDLDPFVEKNELIRRLASILVVDEEGLQDIVIGVERLARSRPR